MGFMTVRDGRVRSSAGHRIFVAVKNVRNGGSDDEDRLVSQWLIGGGVGEAEADG